jgi:hypothetical protein
MYQLLNRSAPLVIAALRALLADWEHSISRRM